MTTVDVVFCIPGNNFSGNFFDCFLKLINYCNSNNIKFLVSRDYCSVVHFARAKILGASNDRGEYQSPFNNKIKYKYLMFIDSDMVFSPYHFKELLKHDKDIVCGYYSMSDRIHTTVVKDWDEKFFEINGTFKFIKNDEIQSIETNKDGLIEVCYCGMGWMLVKNGVFEKIKYPWFYPQLEKIGNRLDMTSEDVAFCRKVSNSGFKIFIDPKIKVGHEKMIVI